MRILGVDYGEKRTGLAISDVGELIARPLETVEASSEKKAVDRIADVCREQEAGRIVVGLPRNMDGTIGPKAQAALAFRQALAEATDVEVVTWDERLSTVRAERALRETQLSRKKRQFHVNAVAAQMILQAYLDWQRSQAQKTQE